MLATDNRFTEFSGIMGFLIPSFGGRGASCALVRPRIYRSRKVAPMAGRAVNDASTALYRHARIWLSADAMGNRNRKRRGR
jgi:hypothetical protein